MMVIVTFDDLRSDRLLALSMIINELSELNNRKKNCNNLMVW
jgi:5-carboxymethyl-2-hydroxymuconate isomerase